MARRGKLTDKQQIFVQEYLVDLNATQAALRAKYSPKNAHRIGWQLLEKTRIREAIQAAMDRRAARTEITADRVLKEYARLAFADMRSFMDWTTASVEFIPAADLSDDDAACVAEISQTITEHGGTLRLKLHDKKGALDALARHLKLDAAKQRHVLIMDDDDIDAIDRDLMAEVENMETRHANGTAH